MRRARAHNHLGAVALAMLVAVGCSSSRRGLPQAGSRELSIVADSDRFPHGQHTGGNPVIRGYRGRGLQCTDCHAQRAVVSGEPARPGMAQHAPCDECHKDEFYKLPGRFCRNCHISVEPIRKGMSPLEPYPKRGLARVLWAEFSHELHLDQAKMDGRVGFHVTCVDCHQPGASSPDPLLPGHKECARCHAGEPARRSKVALEDCQGCHPQRNVDLVRGRRLVTRDLIFAHRGHQMDRRGQPIACTTCHEGMALARRAADVGVPTMQRCAGCHEDAEKTPDRVRIANCSVCHQAITAGLAPRSHLLGQEVPEDHTLAFRKDHGKSAAAKDARCASCHAGLSGSPKDTCYECHQTWKPRDHSLAWREDDHGREAVAERERCAVCHTAKYCTACHSVPPRTHQPYSQFRLGGHAEVARFDLRSCYACHSFERTCSGCHRGTR